MTRDASPEPALRRLLRALRRHWPLLAVLALVAAAFGQSIGFPFSDWDDPFYVTGNPLVAHPLGQGLLSLLATHQQGYPIPVTIGSYALDYALFGLSPAAFHASSLLLHGLGVALVYGVGLRLGLRRPLAGLASGVYGLHPVLVEPVCWVTGRKDLLAVGLLLGAIWVLLGSGSVGAGAADPSARAASPGRRRWVVVLGLAALAMLAKPSAVVAPVLLWGAARFAPFGAALSRRRLAAWLAPLALLAAGLVVAGVLGLRRIGDLPPRTLGGAMQDVLGAAALSVKNLLSPGTLSAAYYRVPGDPSLPLMVSVWIGLGGLAWFLWRRAARGSLVRLGLGFALVAYLPVSNLVHLRRFVADSYLALPLVGVALGGAGLLQARWPERLPRGGRLVAPLVLAVLAGLSAMQARVWSRDVDLWAPVLERYPMRPEPYGLLARAYWRAGQRERAAHLFVTQAERFPAWSYALSDQAWAYATLGNPARAYALLERGVRLGDPAAVEHYLLVLIRSGTAPPGQSHEVVARAFRLGFPHLKGATRDPRVFQRLAKILRSLSLPELAKEAETWAAHLGEGGRRAPRGLPRERGPPDSAPVPGAR